MGSDHFSDMILADLIQEGYEGKELLGKFREKQTALRGAVQHLITESGDAARQYKKDSQTEELFTDVMGD
ncbi:hypothetical protein E6C60_2112 [Paenibacillus algicola]|uniref:Uncharacterized protein n=2 Tax=Paenibacillus TaxID=44249 RepID=A0A4P8XJK2_9BACL|nr:hypothetical protein E6C60_2112 [Paenibacillus algicola]